MTIVASPAQDETNWQDDEAEARTVARASDKAVMWRIIADYAGHDLPDGTQDDVARAHGRTLRLV